MGQNRKKYWHVCLLLIGNDLPKDYISGLSEKDRALIKNKLETIEFIEYPSDWPGVKQFTHDKAQLIQLPAGNHRIYLHIVSHENKRIVIVCYICRKKGQTATLQDKNRAAINIRLAKDRYSGED